MLGTRISRIAALAAVVMSLTFAAATKPAFADGGEVCTAGGGCQEIWTDPVWHCYWIAPMYPGALWAYVYVGEYVEGGPAPSDPDALVVCDDGGW
jgi:hypothetical protein